MANIGQQPKQTDDSSTSNFTIGLLNGLLLSIPLWSLIIWGLYLLLT
mgnify:CR=1 FL=1